MAEVLTATGARGWTDEFKLLFAFLRLAGTSLLNSQADAIQFVRSFRHWELGHKLTIDVYKLFRLNAPKLRDECRLYRML